MADAPSGLSFETVDPMHEPNRATSMHSLAQRARRLFCVAACITCLAGASLADVVVLKGGRRVEGKILVDDAHIVRVRTAFGELEFPKADVLKIERGETAREELARREKEALTADDFHALGLWADGKRLVSDAKRCMKRALALDRMHAGANEFLGLVLFRGEWITPEERDVVLAREADDAQRAQGLVPYEGRWVRPQEKERLERGLVLVGDRWLTPDEVKREQGLELFGESWMPRAEALARADAERAADAADEYVATALVGDVLLVGPFSSAQLAETGQGMLRAREWFERVYRAPAGLELFGGRLAEFYLWGRDSEPYLGSVQHFADLTETDPPGWVEAARATQGFVFYDPYPVSSARQAHRNEVDLVGHCHHHWGHVLANRLGYDGRLLPPWYDEGVACLVEFVTHGQNRVFCRALAGPASGTSARRAVYDIDPAELRRGRWRAILQGALEAGRVEPFDNMAARDFAELETLDLVAGMAIVAWLESLGPDALARFHAVLREAAPLSPERVVQDVRARQAIYDRAFGAAADLDWRRADQAWRAWIAGP